MLLACGGNAADPDRQAAPAPSNEVEPGDVAADEGDTEVVSAVEAVGARVNASPLCEPTFQACGGLLAGAWVVEAACTQAAPDTVSAVSWDHPLDLNLSARACPDVVPRLTLRWSGSLLFQNGEVFDERLRSDTLEMSFSSACLGNAFGVAVGDQNLAEVCSWVQTDTTGCSARDGGCSCSAHGEKQPNASGSYGVIGDRVAVASGREPMFFDYCVEGDLLRFQDPDSGQYLVLRRLPTD